MESWKERIQALLSKLKSDLDVSHIPYQELAHRLGARGGESTIRYWLHGGSPSIKRQVRIAMLEIELGLREGSTKVLRKTYKHYMVK